MAADRLEVAKAKELRGDIIERLYGVYSERIPVSTLRGILRYKGYNTDAGIKKSVDYLLGKGYVELTQGDDDFWSRLIVLTPTGVNLAEGDIMDAGAVLDE